MTWSFSRIRCFEQCPYQFFLSYIASVDSCHQFYADFGSYVHGILAKIYCGNLSSTSASRYYVDNFFKEIGGVHPSRSIVNKFFSQGLQFILSAQKPQCEIIGVEKEISFHVSDVPFTGFIDLLLRDDRGDYIIVDHKSHPLKQRSKRKRPTAADGELDSYLRQLYLYSAYLEQAYSALPRLLVFNCYRTGNVIIEPFSYSAYEETKEWAKSAVQKIEKNTDWSPLMDFYGCKYICNVQHECEYYEMGVEK